MILSASSRESVLQVNINVPEIPVYTAVLRRRLNSIGPSDLVGLSWRYENFYNHLTQTVCTKAAKLAAASRVVAPVATRKVAASVNATTKKKPIVRRKK